MMNEEQELFKIAFKNNFDSLISTGVPKNEAAAKALILTKLELSTKSIPKTPEPKLDTAFTQINTTILQEYLQDCSISKNFSPIVKLTGAVFSSPESLIANFQSTQEPDQNGLPIVNIDEVQEVYLLLFKNQREDILNSITNAFERLIQQLPFFQGNILKPILVVFEYPHLIDPSMIQILRSLLRLLDSLPAGGKDSFTGFLCMSGESRFLRLLHAVQQFLTVKVFEGELEDGRLAARTLGLFNSALPTHPGVPLSAMYNDAVNHEYLESREGRVTEYRLWLTDRRTSSSRSLISYPFLLSPSVKASILELDTSVQMRQEMDQQIEMAIARGQRFVIPYLLLRVSRENIVLDTLSQLMLYERDADFKRPLKVVFDDEEGVDAGGVRKEFFQIMSRRLLDPSYGMFKAHEESRLLWFNSDSLESEMEFELVGLLLGIAIYNSIIIDLPMPLAVYKKLKGHRCDLSDLETLEPSVGRGLRALLTHPGDCSELGHCFQLSYEFFDVKRTVDLKEGGGDITVDNSNREEFVALYVHYLLHEAVVVQFAAFERGFKKVCGGSALDLFQPSELQLLICGNPTLDFEDLERGTRYEDGLTASSPVVLHLWTVLHSLDEPNKRRFLKFVSGSDCSPIDGLSKLGFVVSKNGTDDSRLPSAHTCFNHLLLPEYSSLEVVRERILYAISETEGFGLR